MTDDLALGLLTPDMVGAWDDFVEQANNGTLFHQMAFLAYHGDRFTPLLHNLVWSKGGTIVAVMPAVLVDEGGVPTLRSPYGASFGGVVHGRRLSLRRAISIVQSLVGRCADLGIRRIEIVATPFPYHGEYTNVVEYAMAAAGFRIVNREILLSVRLDAGEPEETLLPRGRTSVRKAKAAGVTVVEGVPAESVYPCLEATRRRVGGQMTHTLEELRRLEGLVPGRIRFDAAFHEGVLVAANMYLVSRHCANSFYPSYSPEHAPLNAVNLLLFHAMESFRRQGLRFLDFGPSSNRMKTNHSTALFKESMGACGYFRDTYRYEPAS